MFFSSERKFKIIIILIYINFAYITSDEHLMKNLDGIGDEATHRDKDYLIKRYFWCFLFSFQKKTNWFCLSLLTVLTVSEVEATSENLRFRGKMYKSRIFVTQMGPTSDFNSGMVGPTNICVTGLTATNRRYLLFCDSILHPAYLRGKWD